MATLNHWSVTFDKISNYFFLFAITSSGFPVLIDLISSYYHSPTKIRYCWNTLFKPKLWLVNPRWPRIVPEWLVLSITFEPLRVKIFQWNFVSTFETTNSRPSKKNFFKKSHLAQIWRISVNMIFLKDVSNYSVTQKNYRVKSTNFTVNQSETRILC